jgi:hypothetical protein
MHDVLSLVAGDMGRHVVEVKLPGEEASLPLVLIEVGARVKMVDVLVETYGVKFTELHRKLAETLYGKGESDRVFGVFFRGQKMVFAFSKELADYSRETKTVDFKDLDEFLVGKIPHTTVSNPTEEASTPVRPSHVHSGSMVVRYALVEKPSQA